MVGHSIGGYIATETLRRSQEKVHDSLCLSFIIASLGLLPRWASRLIVLKSIARSWSATAVEAAFTNLLQLSVTPDWIFMRENQGKIAFLYGVDDQWAPLQMYDEISKQVPNVVLSIEREGHAHNFSCTEAGSVWVAHHVASLIKKQISS